MGAYIPPNTMFATRYWSRNSFARDLSASSRSEVTHRHCSHATRACLQPGRSAASEYPSSDETSGCWSRRSGVWSSSFSESPQGFAHSLVLLTTLRITREARTDISCGRQRRIGPPIESASSLCNNQIGSAVNTVRKFRPGRLYGSTLGRGGGPRSASGMPWQFHFPFHRNTFY
jgi:hypothetical protein